MSKKNKYGLDQFYTKPKVVKKCLETLDLQKYDVIVEPSAGEGSFFNISLMEKKYYFLETLLLVEIQV